MIKHDLAITGGTVASTVDGEETFEPATVLVSDGRIEAILDPGIFVDADEVLDATGMWVLPGVIDAHVHCRDPSFPHRGDFESETRAAAAGGVTTILEMPISKPCTATYERLMERQAIADAKAHVNVGFYVAPGLLDDDELQRMIEAGAVAFKLFTTRAPEGREDEFEGLIASNMAHLVQVLERARELGVRCIFHAEDASLLDLYRARALRAEMPDFRRHQASRPAIAEATAVASIVQASMATGCPVHIAHVTSAEVLEIIRNAKRAGAPVTAETCPHYLFATDDELERAGAFGVINPPIRFVDDQDALWESLRDGTLDLVSTDHAPFSRQEKLEAASLLDAPPGHPGLESLLPLMITAALDGRIPLERVVELLTSAPAATFGLDPEKGRIEANADADIVIYDPRTRNTIRNGEGYSRAADCNALFDGLGVTGHVATTIVAGTIVYQAGQIMAPPGTGRIVKPSRNPKPSFVRSPLVKEEA